MGGPAGSAQQGKSDEGEDTRDQGEGGSVGQRAQEETEGRDSREAGCGKRVVGPAMPSAAMLAAAAEAAQHAPAQGSEEQVSRNPLWGWVASEGYALHVCVCVWRGGDGGEGVLGGRCR
eukprot:1160421-Pelagomonas_calceolata.AAC.1